MLGPRLSTQWAADQVGQQEVHGGVGVEQTPMATEVAREEESAEQETLAGLAAGAAMLAHSLELRAHSSSACPSS